MERDYAELADNDLARLARDDHDAFEALYRRYVTPIYRYCYARTDNVADAEDLTAQTFLAMAESIERYREARNFPAWLFGIARHKCADHHRAAYAAQQQPLPDIEFADPEPEDVEERLVRFSILECVERLLTYLSPDRVEALRLRYWGGLSMREAARVMQRSEAAFKMLISRAISDLRERCVTP
ncbi:MAG: RNA polymerase sigma factor [Anaerolineae bacterium]|nr:RNA polymerase sigma factor [Anaerolineae bacterium]